jgi:hypothetical protein
MSYIRKICRMEKREPEIWELQLDRELDDMAYRERKKSFAADARGDDATDEDDQNRIEDDEEDDDGAGGGDGDIGENDRHALEKLADLLVASGSHADKASALNFLLHDKRGTALAQRHKREDASMSSEQHFEKALRDHGVVAVCKTAVDQGFVPCSEHALTEALTKYAVEQFKLPRERAFAKLYNDELVVRQAIQVAKAFPNQVTVTPVFVGGQEARDVNDPKSALAQINALVEEARKRAPFKKTTAQLFAEVYRDNPELAAREREENRPTGHPSYPPAGERERVR